MKILNLHKKLINKMIILTHEEEILKTRNLLGKIIYIINNLHNIIKERDLQNDDDDDELIFICFLLF